MSRRTAVLLPAVAAGAAVWVALAWWCARQGGAPAPDEVATPGRPTAPIGVAANGTPPIARAGRIADRVDAPTAPTTPGDATEPDAAGVDPATVALRRAPDAAVWQRAATAADEPAFTAFARWTARYRAAAPGKRAALMAAGIEAARTRRAALKALIPADPEAALRETVPYEVRRELPPEILALLEEPVAGAGRYRVSIACGFGDAGNADRMERAATQDGEDYTVYTFGRRLEVTSKQQLSLMGIALEGALALDESPVRVLSDAERADRGLPPGGIAVQAGDAIRVLPDEAAARAWAAALVARELDSSPTALLPGDGTTAAAPEATATAAAPVDVGRNTLLYIIAKFSDEADYPQTEADALTEMAVVSTFYRNNTGGRTWLEGRINPSQPVDVVFVTLPQPMSYGATYNSNLSELLSDARTAASAAGYHYADYNLYIVATSDQNFTYAGRSYINSTGCHLVKPYFTLRTAGHELGHNFGLWHANYWRTDSESPIGQDTDPGGYVSDTTGAETEPDEWIEYGHRFSIMSGQSHTPMDDPTQPHFSVREKSYLGYLPGTDVLVVTGDLSSPVKLYRQDHLDAAGVRAIHIDLPATDYAHATDASKYRYWLSYRDGWTYGTGGTWLPYGLQVDWAQNTYGSSGAIQLDMTPYTRDDSRPIDQGSLPGSYWTYDNADKEDGALLIGRTYSDEAADIHFTPLARGDDDGIPNTGDEWLSVQVHVGTRATDRPPTMTLQAPVTEVAAGQGVTFSVAASDPDGDPLAYWWDFGTNTFASAALNTSAVTRSWSAAGEYRVRCVVSDMKGRIASDSVVVRVGAPTVYRIQGRVLNGGLPVAEARVFVNGTIQTRTDSDGNYVLAGLAAGAYTIQCDRDGLTLTPQFANPVSVNAAIGDAWARDFYADGGSGGGAVYSIGGRVTDADVGLPDVEITAGGLRTLTDAGGNFLLSGLPDGTYTLAARRAGYTFTPATLPVTISGGDRTGNNFSRAYYPVSGALPAFDKNTPLVSDGHREAAATYSNRNKVFSYSLQVPVGTWDITARVMDHSVTFSPYTFTNPLTVTGAEQNISFSGTTVAGYFVEGDVTDQYGRPAVGIAVSDGTRTAWTDTEGHYRLAGVPAGSAVLTPAGAGWSFTPVSRTPTVAGDMSGQDFAAQDPNAAPTIAVAAAASPSTVASPGGFATLSVLGADDAGEAGLVYRWAAIVAAGPIVFSANDANGAKSTVATFSAGGNYRFEVLVEDAGGLRAASTTDVAVAAAGSLVTVSPYEARAASGGTLTFTATAWDETGAPSSVGAAWSVSGGGTIDAGGHFAAGAPGGPYTVTAVANGATGTATVVVIPGDFDGDGIADNVDPDDDNDGIPDTWEQTYGYNPYDATDATLDDDGDSFTTLEEYIADTVPTADASFFHVETIARHSPPSVSFLTATGRLYRVEYSDDLRLPDGWQTLTNAVPGTGGTLTIEDPTTPEPPMRTYRLGVRLP